LSWSEISDSENEDIGAFTRHLESQPKEEQKKKHEERVRKEEEQRAEKFRKQHEERVRKEEQRAVERLRKEEEQRAEKIRKQSEEERRRQEEKRRQGFWQKEEAARQKARSEEAARQKVQKEEETDFCRVWREPIELLQKAKGNERKSAFGLRRPWMQEIREGLFDFSKMEEDAESLSEVLAAQEHVLSADFAASQGNGVPTGGSGFVERGTEAEDAEERRGREEKHETERLFMSKFFDDAYVPQYGGGALVGSEAARCEEGVEKRSTEEESVVEEDSLPGDMSEEQWLRASSDKDSDNRTIWYTDQVRKWYKHAVPSLKSHQSNMHT